MVAVLLPPAKLRLAQAARTQRDTKVGDLCPELGITRQTFTALLAPRVNYVLIYPYRLPA